MRIDVSLGEENCPKCGSHTYERGCDSCGGEGVDSHECGDDTYCGAADAESEGTR